MSKCITCSKSGALKAPEYVALKKLSPGPQRRKNLMCRGCWQKNLDVTEGICFELRNLVTCLLLIFYHTLLLLFDADFAACRDRHYARQARIDARAGNDGMHLFFISFLPL